jgi:hypothetical protein
MSDTYTARTPLPDLTTEQLKARMGHAQDQAEWAEQNYDYESAEDAADLICRLEQEMARRSKRVFLLPRRHPQVGPSAVPRPSELHGRI